ncbi:hypothetical protein OEZ85_013695 [Tetradesmus obliquus]|uniref:Uncharacterized protein n=1 Tax=Tetradesmus obliquus TaxID=3088 RepID=A0ABY8URQ8_TETOB|nr:hypothetical protein OEZ85_013695 [Tetradesmus obliquus]WIA24089.1 hypothetical protein OEZ85_013695 [Tetradesmus obliquus]
MIEDGLAGLKQLRAVQLSVDGGFNAEHAAFHWGVGAGQQGAGGASNIAAIGQLTRLTHLALHANGADSASLTAALLQLTNIRELLMSGPTPLLLPQLLLSPTFQQQQQQQQGLQLLVLQQQLGLWELQKLLQRFSGLKYLEVLGFWEAAGAVQSLGPVQGLMDERASLNLLKRAAVNASTLLGPAADLLSQANPCWLEELMQAAWQLLLQRLLMKPNELQLRLPPLMTMSEPTAAASTISLLQLLLPAVRAAAAAAGQQDGGMLPVVADSRMPAVALEELLDYVFCAGPFDAPAEPTDEQQAADLAAEHAALSALRSGLAPRQQQQGLGGGGAQGLGHGLGSPGRAAAPAAAAGAAAAGEEPAAAAAEPAAAAAAADGLRSLALSVPPCLEGFKSPENNGPVDVRTLPELQMWMGDSGVGFGAAQLAAAGADTPAAADAAGSSIDEQQQQQQQQQGFGGAKLAAADTPAAADAAGSSSDEQQQQQQQWLLQVGQQQCSFAGSFLAGGPAAAPEACCFAGLGVLTVSNLSRADGPWEPSAVLGDQLLAAVAFGCPGLKTLELSGVLAPTPLGLLLLRRLPLLTKLRLEQWTNTASDVADQQLPVAVACLPHGLTSLGLTNVEPEVLADPLQTLAAAVRLAGGVEAVAAAADAAAAAAAASRKHSSRSSSSSSSSSSSEVKFSAAAMSAAAQAVLNAAEAAEGPGSATRSSSSSSSSNGLGAFLAAGLPHAAALQRLHVSTPGGFDAMPPSEAAIYGLTAALNAATLHAFDAATSRAMSSVHSSGWWQRFSGSSGSSSSSSSSRGLGKKDSGRGSSHAWLASLRGLPGLTDLHLDMPLVLPGQLEALAASVAASSSLRSLSLHGVALNMYASHQLLLNTLMDHQMHMITHHSPHAVSEMAMGHASAASSADKQLIRLLTSALQARGVSDLSVRMHGSGAADKLGAHGVAAPMGAGRGSAWGGAGAASGSGKGAVDESDGDDDDDAGSDGGAGGSNSSSNNNSNMELVQPRMRLGFFERTGVSGAFDNLGSCAASCLAYTTVSVMHSIRRPASQPQQPTWWAVATLQRAWGAVRIALATGLALTVALLAMTSTYFASEEELEHLRAVGFMPPQAQPQQDDHQQGDHQHNDTHGDGVSSEWEEEDEELEEDEQQQDMEIEHVEQHQAPPAPAAPAQHGMLGNVQAALGVFLHPEAAAAAGGGGLGGFLGGPHVNPEAVDMGIQELLNPDGEDKPLEADANGGMTGIPVQVQVVAGLNSVASWSFVVGAAPVAALGVWFWGRQLKWAVSGAFALARYAFS